MENFAVSELSLNELIAIDGGKPVGYYFGYALGVISGTTISFVAGLIAGLEGEHN
jgi:hypothetical protein